MSIKKQTIVAALLGLVVSSGAFAQNKPFIFPSSFYSVGVDSYTETYRESDDNGSRIMQEQAHMKGVSFKATLPLGRDSSWRWGVNYATGSSTYTGAVFDSATGVSGAYGSYVRSGLDRKKVELFAEHVQLWRESDALKTTIGATYRQLTDRLDQAGAEGYKRSNELLTLDISVGKDYYFSGFTVNPRIGAKFLMDGKQRSYILTDGSAVKNKQNEGYGLNAEVAITVPAGANSFTITPYVKYMQVNKSEAVALNATTALYEPKNKTQEAGVKIVFNF